MTRFYYWLTNRCPVCKGKRWTFTYLKGQKCGCV